MQAQNDSVSYVRPMVYNIPNGMNLEEAAPLITKDQSRIYFTVTDKMELSQNGKLKHEIWYAEIEDGIIQDPIKAEKPLNIGLNSAVVGMNEEGTRLYLFGAFNKFFENEESLSYSDLVDGEWQKPKSIEIPGLTIDGGYYGFHVHQNEDVILISQDAGNQEDLFITSYDEETRTWSTPVKLNSEINTEFNELSPFLSHDYQKLYFSRSTPNGGADVYVSQRTGESLLDWSTPERLSDPINTEGYDAFFTIDADNNIAYASDRNGSVDIYLSKMTIEETQTELPDEITLAADLTTDLEMADEVEFIRPRVFEFDFNAESKNYVFFEFNSDKVSKNFANVLELVADHLIENPDLVIEVAGHTDYIDTEQFNYRLSDKRAIAVSKLLMQLGVTKERIFPIGYGESSPVSSNRNSKGRALNRRVELIIMTKESFNE
jgi:outer membrane protein OmpA-like peptidoglycan-associated protein